MIANLSNLSNTKADVEFKTEAIPFSDQLLVDQFKRAVQQKMQNVLSMAVETLIKIIQQSKTESTVTKQIRTRNKSWLNTIMIENMTIGNKLYKKTKNHPTNEETHQKCLNKKRNFRIIIEAKNQYINFRLEKAGKDTRKLLMKTY